MRPKKHYLIIAILILAIVIVAGSIFFLRSIYVVPILMYHLVDQSFAETKLSVSPSSFARQMEFLNKHKYNVVSIEELIGLLKQNKSIQPKTVAITFDDGYENNYTSAFPLLKKYKLPATIFMVIDNIGKKGFLNPAQINEMIESGLVSIGSHTMSHAHLPSLLDKTRLRNEIFESKKALEGITGQKKTLFSYPVGGFNEEIRQMVKDAGYLGACATSPGKGYPKNDTYALKRVRISRTSDNLFVFLIEASGYYTFIKEIRDEE